MKDMKDITKFRLSMLSTLGSFSMYLYHIPSIALLDSMMFLGATQAITMSSQAFNQSMEGEHDKLMTRTKNRPVPSGKISKKQGL